MFKSKKLVSAAAVSSIAVAAFFSAQSSAQVTAFSHDFEGLGLEDLGTDISDLGWQVAGQAFDGSSPFPGLFSYFYGLFPAPNGGPGFSSIATGDATSGGVGTQYLNVYNDYNNTGEHDTGVSVVNALVLQEFTITAADIGAVITFSFDAKRPDFVDDGFGGDASPAVGANCTVPCIASAFLKTLDPNAGFAATNLLEEDMSAISQSTWGAYSFTLDLSDPLLVGQVLQMGFENTTTSYNNTGVYYDNVNLVVNSAPPATVSIPVPGIAIFAISALLGLTGVSAIRKRAKR